MRRLLAVDIGGSKLRLASATDAAAEVSRVEVPSKSVNEHGWEAVKVEVRKTVELLLAKSDFVDTEVDVVFASVAGAGNEQARRAWIDLLETLFPQAIVQVVPDHQLSIIRCDPLEPAIGIVAGTGLSVVARSTAQSSIIGVDGWGPLVGDEGSGFWIGREGLRSVLKGHDGRAKEPSFGQSLLDALDLGKPEDIPVYFSHGQTQVSAVANLAQIILEAADQGEPVAVEIAACASSKAAGSVRAAHVRIGAPTSFNLGVAGGLLVSSDTHRARVVSEVENVGLRPRQVLIVKDPVLVALGAAASLGRPAPESRARP